MSALCHVWTKNWSFWLTSHIRQLRWPPFEPQYLVLHHVLENILYCAFAWYAMHNALVLCGVLYTSCIHHSYFCICLHCTYVNVISMGHLSFTSPPLSRICIKVISTGHLSFTPLSHIHIYHPLLLYLSTLYFLKSLLLWHLESGGKICFIHGAQDKEASPRLALFASTWKDSIHWHAGKFSSAPPPKTSPEPLFLGISSCVSEYE